MSAGILVCSVAVLMQEILLTRIFSFTIWYHLAYLTISTALLGFGAAGSLLAAYPGWMKRDPTALAARCASLAGLALIAVMAVLGRVPLSPSVMLSAPAQFFTLLLGYYAGVVLPFFLGGVAVATPIAAFPAAASRLYAADLFGASLGCLLAVAALSTLDGAGAVVVCAAVFAAAGACYAFPRREARIHGALALGLLAAAPFAERAIVLVPTETKMLGQALRTPGTELMFTRWSAVNRVDLYRDANPRAAFWSGNGVARGSRAALPLVLSIQYDAHNGSNVFRVDGPDALAFLDDHILRTPYVLAERPRVLVIGVGGGVDVLNALQRDARSVTGVELQPITVDLHNGVLADWTGGWFQRPEVQLVAAEGRHFVRSHPEQYDVVQITAVDTFSAQTTGAYVLAESYLYTVEAFKDYLAHLSDSGILSIVLGDTLHRNPGVASPLVTRLLMVARQALLERGIAEPERHIALVTDRLLIANRPSLPFTTPDEDVVGAFVGVLLVKPTPLTPDEVSRLQAFAMPKGFMTTIAPGLPPTIPAGELLRASAADLPALLERQPFVLEPVTDDRPFFYHVHPWASLLRGERSLWFFPGSTIGQLMLVMMLGQGLLLGGLLVLLPLRRGARGALPGRTTMGFLLYFVALGLGFLLIEISFVQKYVLLLGYPTYSLSVTVASLLVFAALGAALSRRGWGRPRRFLSCLLVATVVLVVLEVLLVPLVRDRFLAAGLAVRIFVTCALQLPLGIVLGMYFPTGIELLRRCEPRLVAWAWGVNGVASVVSAVIAVVLGMSIGFSGVALVAALIYVVGTLSLVAVLPRDGSA